MMGFWMKYQIKALRSSYFAQAVQAGALRRAEQERDRANDLTDKVAAELRLVTRERDSLARRCAVRFEQTQALEAELDRTRRERDGLRSALLESLEARAHRVLGFKRTLAMRDVALALVRAELASARQELDAVCTARDNLDRELGEAKRELAGENTGSETK